MAAKDFKGEMDLTYPPFRPTELTDEMKRMYGSEFLSEFPFLYPMLTDSVVLEEGKDPDENADDIVHPIVAAIEENGNKWDEMQVIGEFRDDHCECVNVEMVVGGKKYGYSDWWLSREGYKMYLKCEGKWDAVQPKWRKDLLEHINSRSQD